MSTNHGPECPCRDCNAERARSVQRPAPWQQLKHAAEGRGHDVVDVLEYLLDSYGPDATTKAVRRAVVALEYDDLHDEAAALAEEWAAWC